MTKSVLLIIFLYISIVLCQSVTLHGFECVLNPVDPPNCINVTHLQYNGGQGGFAIGETTLTGLELGNGTKIDIKFEVLGVSLGFVQTSEGIYRNGFTNSIQVGMCPNAFAPNGTWCEVKCKCSGVLCHPQCVLCKETPCQSPGGLAFCNLCDTVVDDTGGRTRCECRSNPTIAGGCPCQGVRLSTRAAACIRPVLVNNPISQQTPSKLEVFRPEGFTGAGVMHVTSPVHDFFILLSNTAQTFIPAKINPFNVTVLVRQIGEIGSSPFNPVQIIGDDIAQQGPSPIDKYLINVDEFYFTKPDDDTRFGPILETPSGKFRSLTDPLSVTSAGRFTEEINGCQPFYKSSPINTDIIDLLNKDTVIKLTEDTYKDALTCQADAAERCFQFNLTEGEEPSCEEGKAFFNQCFDGNVEANQPSEFNVNFGLRGIVITGEVPIDCDVIKVEYKSCFTDGESGNGGCIIELEATGTGTVTFFHHIDTGGFIELPVDCKSAIFPAETEGVNLDKWEACFYVVAKVNAICSNESTNFTFAPAFGFPTTPEPNPLGTGKGNGGLNWWDYLLIILGGIAFLILLSFALPIITRTGAGIGDVAEGIGTETERLIS